MQILSNLSLYGTLGLNSVADANTDTDKFLVIDSNGIVKYRTGQELYNDIGAGGVAAYTSKLQHEVKAGVALTKGQAVYVTSADGTNMIVGKASNASEPTSSKTLGLLVQDLAINDIGFVVTEGLIAGLDTSTALAGDPVWLGTDGNLLFGLSNKPHAPAHMVFIGIVTRVQQNNGEIFVKVQNGFELDEIHNVQITSTPSDNAVLAYETSTSLYKMKSISTLLGYTPTSNARTLTINGTSYDLSADRSWSVGTHTGNLTTGYVPKATGATTLTDSLIYDNGSAIGINTNSPYESSAFKLDVNGGLLIKNTSGTAAQLILINSNPATGGNNGFVQLSAGGNTATAFGQWQTYYGMSVASGALRLQPAGGQVLIGTSTASAFLTDINGTLRVSGQLTLGSTISNNTYVYTMPGASGTLALVSDIPSLSGYLTISSAAATYLTQTSASNTYLTLTNASATYLSQTSASNTYLTLTNASATYLSQTSASNTYLTLTNAAATYLSQTSASNTYLTLTNASSTYLTQTNASNTYVSLSGSYANPSWVTSLAWSKITGAPAFITGITSGMVTTALGYTPVTNARTITINGTAYDLSADRSWTVTATETDTLASVTARGASTSSAVTLSGAVNIYNTDSNDFRLYYQGAGSGSARVYYHQPTNELRIYATSASPEETTSIGSLKLYISSVYRAVLHEANYSSYALPLSGGTVTGKTNIGTGGSTSGGIFNVTGGTDNQMNISHNSSWGLLLGYCNESSPSGYHGPNHAAIINVQDAPLHLGSNNSSVLRIVSTGASILGNTVWHAGNLTNLNQLSNGPGYITSSALSSYVPYGNWSQSTGMNDSKLYLRTNGDNNHYLWNANDDWEELNAYEGTGFRITSVGGTVGVLYVYGSSNGGYTYSPYSFRAPIFYDSQDTSYYLDPNGNSVLTTATFNLNASSTLTLTSAGTNASMVRAGSGDELYIGGNGTWQMRFSGANVLMDNGGYLQNNESIRAPIFYDSNDTSYYLDPNSLSNLSSLRLPGSSAYASLMTGPADSSRTYADGNRKAIVINADYYPALYLNAFSGTNTTHGAYIVMSGTLSAGGFRQWTMGIANYDPGIFSIGYNDNMAGNGHYGTGDGWSGSDVHHGRLIVDTSGNLKIRGMLYVNGTSGGMSTGNAVLHSSNYNSYAVPLSGGTMTGTLAMHEGAYYGTITFGSSSYWRAGISQRDATNAELRIWAKGGAAGSIYFATGFDGESSATTLPADGMALKNNKLGIGGWAFNEFPSYKLHVKGDVYANGGWLRVSGDSGLYFESYGGGWRMTGSSYIESYGSKSLHMQGASVDYVGSLYFSGAGHIQPNAGSYGALQMTSSKNGWAGIRFTEYNTNLMTNATTSGFHHNDYGWQFKWDSGNAYVYSGTYGGGSAYTVIHSSNIGSQSVNYASSSGSAGAITGRSKGSFTVGGSTSTFYPVAFQIGSGATGEQGISVLQIERGGYDEPGYSNYTFSTFHCRIRAKADGWGYGASYVQVEANAYTVPMLAEVSQQNQTSQLIVWLRGGCSYRWYDVEGNWGLNFSNGSGTSYTTFNGNAVYSPTTTNTIGSNFKYQQGWGNNYVSGRLTAGGGVTAQSQLICALHSSATPDYSNPLWIWAAQDSDAIVIQNTTAGGTPPKIYFRDTNATIQTSNTLIRLRTSNSDSLSAWLNGSTWNVTGDVVAYASDKRLKENIKTIPNALEKINVLSGVTFDWNNVSEKAGFVPKSKYNEVGVLAQDVQKVLPQAVEYAPFDRNDDGTSRSGKDYLTVKYEKIVPLLIEAIKEQQTQIENLKSKLDAVTK